MNTVTVPVTRKKTVCTKTGQKHFIGIDMHKKFMQVAVMDSDGTVMPNERIGCDKRIVKREFAKFPDDAKYVLESSSVWYGMYRFLRDQMNLDVVLSNPRVTKMIAASKKKTDGVDAGIPADLLRGGYIIECYIPDEETVGMRQPVRYGDRTVGERTRFKNLIHGILPRDGIKIAGLPFSAEFIDGLHKLGNRRMEKHLRTVRFLDEDISDCNIRIQKEMDKSHRARLLTTIPGIGNITALALASEIDDISRFSDMDKLASYFGIVPSVRNSAETVQHGRITRTGNSIVRHLLVEAAIVHVTFAKKSKRATPISTFYERLAKKRGGSKAKVAAAAKILRIVFWMLKKDVDFWTCIEEGRKNTYRKPKTRPAKGKK